MNSDWRSYPFQLVPGDELLDFPAAEGEHPDQESDTWFIAGQLDAASRSFAFLTIFNKNRPAGSRGGRLLHVRALRPGQRHVWDLYRLRHAAGQHEARRAAQIVHGRGHLDLGYEVVQAPRSWTTCRDDEARLRPYTYRVSLVGDDQAGRRRCELDLAVAATRAPTPLGASTYNGKMVCFGQNDTYSYFQTGMTMTGTLRWGEVTEQVTGTRGHVDRQWFPKYPGGGAPVVSPRPVTRMAHDQFRQRCRPEHLASVRSDERQCVATVYRYATTSPTGPCRRSVPKTDSR